MCWPPISRMRCVGLSPVAMGNLFCSPALHQTSYASGNLNESLSAGFGISASENFGSEGDGNGTEQGPQKKDRNRSPWMSAAGSARLEPAAPIGLDQFVYCKIAMFVV
jgi:hypothetical protein